MGDTGSGRIRGQHEAGQMGGKAKPYRCGLPNKISCSMSTHLLPCGRTSGGQIRGSLMHERGRRHSRAEIQRKDKKKETSNLLIKFAELSVGVRVNAIVNFSLYTGLYD